jgi:hypothetical protein
MEVVRRRKPIRASGSGAGLLSLELLLVVEQELAQSRRVAA